MTNEQPIRARVPDHVSGGAFSTGVIVMTANTEFVLDFVQNLGRPHQIVSRVVMPHSVLPQLVDALRRNMELYRSRWGELPRVDLNEQGQSGVKAKPPQSNQPPSNAASALSSSDVAGLGFPTQDDASATDPSHPKPAAKNASDSGNGNRGSASVAGNSNAPPPPGDPQNTPENPFGGPAPSNPSGSGARQAMAQDVYDDLKIKDELLSGVYANAVMIGHGPYEFSFDFITNFYPHSAVSARVFMAAGQVPRLYDSLNGTWEQLRHRMQPPPSPNQDHYPQFPEPPKSDDDFDSSSDEDQPPFA